MNNKKRVCALKCPRVFGFLIGFFLHSISANVSAVTTEVFFFSHDQQGSITSIADEKNQGVLQQGWSAWGGRLDNNNQSTMLRFTQGHPMRFGYTGHKQLLDADLVLAGDTRMYDSELKRFYNTDDRTTGAVRGNNRFAYVYNNPLAYVDPDGHAPQSNPLQARVYRGEYAQNFIADPQNAGQGVVLSGLARSSFNNLVRAHLQQMYPLRDNNFQQTLYNLALDAIEQVQADYADREDINTLRDDHQHMRLGAESPFCSVSLNPAIAGWFASTTRDRRPVVSWAEANPVVVADISLDTRSMGISPPLNMHYWANPGNLPLEPAIRFQDDRGLVPEAELLVVGGFRYSDTLTARQALGQNKDTIVSLSSLHQNHEALRGWENLCSAYTKRPSDNVSFSKTLMKDVSQDRGYKPPSWSSAYY